MLVKTLPHKLAQYVFALIVMVLVAGCGGGGAGTGPITTVVDADTLEAFADTGPIIAVRVGDTAMLDGSRSKTNSIYDQPLTYAWTFTSKPKGSTAALQDATTEAPSFVADAKGVYTVELVVDSEGITSRRQVGIVVATIAPERPTGPFNHAALFDPANPPGLSANCADCHDGTLTPPAGGSTNLLNKHATHFGSSDLCQACHTPQSFAAISYVDHQEIFGNCSECHNGIIAIGKSPYHTPTNAECNDCHNTTHFLELEADGSFDHSGVSSACTACHNGQVATGKHDIHIVTESQCGYCHFTTGFLPAYPDHTGPSVVGQRCDTCHGVGSTPGEPLGHPTMDVDCSSCHSINTFSMGGVFNHAIVDSISQPCQVCHTDTNGIGATGKSAAVPTHPVTNSDCSNCHNVDTFLGAFTDHTGITSGCSDACHVADGSGTAGGHSLSHMPTTPANQDCAVCHTPGTFTSGSYDHTGVTSGCNQCHNNTITAGKLVNHMPTNPDTQDCADCHNTTEFANTLFDHQGIDTNNCALCHNGDISTGKPTRHLPTTLDCSSCHNINDLTTFAGITFNHAGIDPNNCSTCHNTGIATPKIANHIPAKDDCSVCHNSTTVGGFATNTFLTSVHTGITRGCEGCHTGKFFPARPALYKTAGHVPTGQDCYLCHNTTAFAPINTPFQHTDISGNCDSCHDGTANYVAVGARGPATTAIHQNLTDDCGACHNTTNFADAFVDHSAPNVLAQRCDACHGVTATGKDAKVNHVTTSDDCRLCHVPGGTFSPAVFSHTGIVSNCASCHDGVGATGKDSAPTTHVTTSQDCSVCHNTDTFAGARFDHTGIVNDCAACHNGNTAPGKVPPPNHVPTNNDCENCHQTTGFLPATFDHVGIVDNCTSCHGAGFAEGKSIGHVATNQDCGVCHNTNTFVGAVFDHTGIVDNCQSCHGSTAIGKDFDHLATNLDCHLCHTTATFRGGSWVHDNSTAGTCDTCHTNGGGATAKPNDHLSTNVQCDECHSTDRWAPDIFSHDPRGDYPGDHRVNPGCSRCHGNSISNTFSWPSSRYAPFCAACHERDFESEGDHNGGKSGTVEQNKNCGASGCHKITDRKFD